MNPDSLTRLTALIENLRAMSVEVQINSGGDAVYLRVLHKGHDTTRTVINGRDTDCLAEICDAIGSMVLHMFDSGAK